MIKKLVIILLTITGGVAMAQTHFYKGNSSYSSDIRFTWDGKSVYKGKSSYSSDIILNIDGNRVFRGRSSYSSDILYRMDGPIPLPVLIMIM